MQPSSSSISPAQLAKQAEIEAQARETLSRQFPTLLHSLLGALWLAACSAAVSTFQAPWPVKVMLIGTAAVVPYLAFQVAHLRSRLSAALVLLRITER